MFEILIIVSTILSFFALFLVFQLRKPKNLEEFAQLGKTLAVIEKSSDRIESNIKTEMNLLREQNQASDVTLRTEIGNSIHNFNSSFMKGFQELSTGQNQKLSSFEKTIGDLTKMFDSRQDSLRKLVDQKLTDIQTDNNKRLEEMRVTVDEKLQGTLEKRLSESFLQVSQRLEQVHKGLGEMQSLANGVGDLKRILTNVKVRGTWGEYQLANILEEMLTKEQYVTNVSVKRGSSELVEFAVRLPGNSEDEKSFVLLPIDSKFPQEDYIRLLDAQKNADPDAEKAALAALEATIKREARTIRDKYINPPVTTNFAIMFLPTESLYAEVLRQPGLAETLQRDCKVMVAGPTTLSALLTSLSVGFRTLVIQKRSAEIWKLLGAVKTQFGTFSNLLENVQKKLDEASSAMEKAANKSRTIEKRLTKVEELPAMEAELMLPAIESEDT